MEWPDAEPAPYTRGRLIQWQTVWVSVNDIVSLRPQETRDHAVFKAFATLTLRNGEKFSWTWSSKSYRNEEEAKARADRDAEIARFVEEVNACL